MASNGFYKTTDTALATFLITSGHRLYNIDYSQPRYEFQFDSDPIIPQRASIYIAGQALIEPIAFNRVNKKLLRIIRSQIQWEED